MIRFIFTASILNADREEKYVERISRTVKQFSHLPITFYVVENGGKRITGLDSIDGIHLLYTDINRIDYSRKGIKECMDILSIADYYSFSENDIIIKLSGLYTLTDPCPLVQAAMTMEEKYDAILKFYNVVTREFDTHDCVLGLYAIRYSILQSFNYMKMLEHPSMECVFAEFVRNEVAEERLLELESLGLEFQGDRQYVV